MQRLAAAEHGGEGLEGHAHHVHHGLLGLERHARGLAVEAERPGAVGLQYHRLLDGQQGRAPAVADAGCWLVVIRGMFKTIVTGSSAVPLVTERLLLSPL